MRRTLSYESRRMDLLAQDERQRTDGRRIRNIMPINTLTTVYEDGGPKTKLFIETLLNDEFIHDRDRVFLLFHSPCHENAFSRGLRVQRWHQKPDTVMVFLDDMAQKLNSGEQYNHDEPFELAFVHVHVHVHVAGSRGSEKPSNKRPGYESTVQF